MIEKRTDDSQEDVDPETRTLVPQRLGISMRAGFGALIGGDMDWCMSRCGSKLIVSLASPTRRTLTIVERILGCDG
jgi:hypothetical protein